MISKPCIFYLRDPHSLINMLVSVAKTGIKTNPMSLSLLSFQAESSHIKFVVCRGLNHFKLMPVAPGVK